MKKRTKRKLVLYTLSFKKKLYYKICFEHHKSFIHCDSFYEISLTKHTYLMGNLFTFTREKNLRIHCLILKKMCERLKERIKISRAKRACDMKKIRPSLLTNCPSKNILDVQMVLSIV